MISSQNDSARILTYFRFFDFGSNTIYTFSAATRQHILANLHQGYQKNSIFCEKSESVPRSVEFRCSMEFASIFDQKLALPYLKASRNFSSSSTRKCRKLVETYCKCALFSFEKFGAKRMIICFFVALKTEKKENFILVAFLTVKY